MNSESAKGLLKWRNSALVCRHDKRKGMFLVTSGGRFNIRRRPLALAGPPTSAKNRGDALFLDRVLNQANTVNQCMV